MSTAPLQDRPDVSASPSVSHVCGKGIAGATMGSFSLLLEGVFAIGAAVRDQPGLARVLVVLGPLVILVALVIVVMAPVLALGGVVASSLAHGDVARGRCTGRGVAKAGLITSIAALVVMVLAVAAMATMVIWFVVLFVTDPQGFLGAVLGVG